MRGNQVGGAWLEWAGHASALRLSELFVSFLLTSRSQYDFSSWLHNCCWILTNLNKFLVGVGVLVCVLVCVLIEDSGEFSVI